MAEPATDPTPKTSVPFLDCLASVDDATLDAVQAEMVTLRRRLLALRRAEGIIKAALGKDTKKPKAQKNEAAAGDGGGDAAVALQAKRRRLAGFLRGGKKTFHDILANGNVGLSTPQLAEALNHRWFVKDHSGYGLTPDYQRDQAAHGPLPLGAGGIE